MSDLSVGGLTSLYQSQNVLDRISSGSMTTEETTAFSQALAKEMAIMQAGQAGTSAAADANPLSAYMPMLMTSVAGQGLEAQLLMLCMMMTTGQADASSIMSVLAQAVAGIQEENEKEKLRRSIMDSSYEDGILDLIDSNVFKSDPSAYPYEAWKACVPLVTNEWTERSAEAYLKVIEQFQVESNPRYANNKKGTGDTYCNIYTWDVTSAMNAELPHYVDKITGEPRTRETREGAQAMTANRTYDWLIEHGETYGWLEVTPEEAQRYANRGLPAVTSWKNPNGSGHLQMVRPEKEGVDYDPKKGVAVAQAGSTLTSYTHADDIYSSRAMEQLKYFVHV